SHNLNPSALERAWQPDVKAVVAVDYAGQPCDLPAIAKIARERGAIVIEDACHGVGGGFVHEGRPWKLGGHPWADMAVFSFHPVKTMTTAEGGMLVTDNEDWARRARQLRSHGIVREASHFLPSASCPLTSERGPWYYEMQTLGYNYRLTDIQCALGISQLKRLDQFVARRREIVRRYNETLGNLPWLRTPGLANPKNLDLISWHLYTVQMDFEGIGKTRTQVMNELRARGIGTQVLYIPVHLQPWYRQTFGYGAGKCPVAEQYYRRCLSLPLYPAMSNDDREQVIQAILQLPA
ncbi:MAG TPA: DegT/DnrJ/EryC1/StrS family aminotransferase, partial [Verrucomicrobiae bacterium]|nr:DegT/DnrJ/EryC1/StrS family aminotransferase [Verrucomicrobiae bacterium]